MNLVSRDEREAAVDNAADRLSFLVLAHGLLVIVAIRAFNGEATWDLLALVILGGFVGLAYRLGNRAVSRRWAAVVAGSVVVAAIAALVLVWLPPR